MTLLDDVYGAWMRGDIEGGLAHCTDDIFYRDQAVDHEAHGKEELAEWVHAGHAKVSDWKVEFETSFGDERHCAAEAKMTGVLIEEMAGKPASDKPFFARYAIFGTITDGKLSRIMIYWNPAEWM
jgi:steroid delta-isomerase-like uncharacterized protein